MDNENDDLARQHTAPLPWIGMYIAAASLACTLAMAADTIRAFWRKKFWFPCKFFTLNATSLTLLAVAMKYPSDITTELARDEDNLAKLSASALMTTVLGNVMTSLGSMDKNALPMNIIATAILVITMTVDICIQIYTHLLGYPWGIEVLGIFFMLILLLALIFSGLTVPTIKKCLEGKYNQYCKTALREELLGKGRLTSEILEVGVKSFWLMAETSDPQFFMARSVACVTPGAICLVNSIVFVLTVTLMRRIPKDEKGKYSDYKWSIMWILAIQSIGVVVGTISPLMRVLMAVSFGSNFEKLFEIEPYWLEKLKEWKASPLPARISGGGPKRRKMVRSMQNGVINVMIIGQIMIVLVNKLILLVFVTLMNLLLPCLYRTRASNEPDPDNELDIGRYVLLLEGEKKLPKIALKMILHEVTKLILIGKRRKPKNLINLLGKSKNFNGVRDLYSERVPSLHSEELFNGWTLPVVTLTSIAIALPKIETQLTDQLISCVTEGLKYANLVEKRLHGKRNFVNKWAKAVWVRVELYREWFGIDLDIMSREVKTTKEALQKFSDIAEEILKKFNRTRKRNLTENSIDKLIKFYAADSMYKTSQTLLFDYEECNDKPCVELFDHISIIIADILSACLSNLPHYISKKCYQNAIEKREESIRKAARLLGETEDILKILENREIPDLNPDEAVYIDKWRAAINQEIP